MALICGTFYMHKIALAGTFNFLLCLPREGRDGCICALAFKKDNMGVGAVAQCLKPLTAYCTNIPYWDTIPVRVLAALLS